jgi:hypothetical protein
MAMIVAFRPRGRNIDQGDQQGRHRPMATNDGFQPDRSPIFLSEYPQEFEQPDAGNGWDVAAISSKILRASILAVAMTAIGIAVLSVGNPVALVADWLDNKPAVQVEAEPSTSAIQSVASSQDSVPTATDASAREEVAAAVQPVEPRQPEPAPAVPAQQAESSQRPAEASQGQTQVQAQGQAQTPGQAGPLLTEELFKQFQAWAAEEETKTQAGSAQTAPVRVAQDAPAPAQAKPAKRHRRVHSVQNARAEIRPQRHYRARIRQEQEVQAQAPPAVDPRAPDPSLQNAQPPSFLQSLGFRNQ